MPKLLSILLLLIFPALLLANPSDKQPHAAMEVHGQQYSGEMLAAAQQTYDKARGLLEKMQPHVASGKFEKLDAGQVGQALALGARLRRVARQMQVLGEPAGVDFEQRGDQIINAAHHMIAGLKNLPQGARGVTVIRGRLSQLAQVKARQIPKLEKLVEQGKYDEAEKELYDILDEFEAYLGFLTPDDTASTLAPFRIQTKIDQAMNEQRRTLASELIIQRREALRPDLAAFLSDVKAATESLGKSGRHSIDGEAKTGPELLAHFDAAWQTLHLQTIRSLGLQGAQAPVLSSFPPNDWSTLRTEYARFTSDAPAALAGLIRADAQRVSAADVPALYAAYLPPAADLADHAASPALERELQQALDTLVGKSPELAASVKTYRASTDELLRWRERVVSEQALSRTAEYEPLARRALAACGRQTEADAGLFPVGAADTSAARLFYGAPAALEAGAPKLIGQSALAEHVVPLAGADEAGIAQYRDRIYGRISLPLEALREEALKLQSLLLVTDDAPPLSLAAMRALRSANRGDVAKTGGTITAVYVEGRITRLVTLPEEAALWLPLGALPDDYLQEDQLRQVVLRVDLEPRWLQHRYFILELPGP